MVYDISVILERCPDMKPIDVTKSNHKRNPHREFTIEKEDSFKRKTSDGNQDSDDEESRQTIEPLIDEKEFKKVFTNDKKHKDVIRSIQYIDITDSPLIMTASYDKNVHLIDFKTHDIVGTLKQGYKTIAKY